MHLDQGSPSIYQVTECRSECKLPGGEGVSRLLMEGTAAGEGEECDESWDGHGLHFWSSFVLNMSTSKRALRPQQR